MVGIMALHPVRSLWWHFISAISPVIEYYFWFTIISGRGSSSSFYLNFSTKNSSQSIGWGSSVGIPPAAGQVIHMVTIFYPQVTTLSPESLLSGLISMISTASNFIPFTIIRYSYFPFTHKSFRFLFM